MKGIVAGVCAALTASQLALGQTPPPPPADASNPSIKSVIPAEPLAAPSIKTPVPDLTSPPHLPNGQDPRYSFDPAPESCSICTIGADYLLWLIPQQHERTIVATDGSQEQRVLVTASDQQLDRRTWSGARLTFGYWLTEPNFFMPNADIRTCGAEARFFAIGDRSITARNDLSPNIFRPFFNLNDRQDNAFIVAFPNLATGLIETTAKMSFWGAEANVWKYLKGNDPYTICSVGVLAGFRFMETDPQIEIKSVSVYEQNLAQFPAFTQFAGNRIEVNDLFATRTRFVGGQIGIGSTLYLERLTVDGTAKLALGTNHQEIHIEGSQVRTLANGQRVISNAGVLALPSNSGRFSQEKFSQIPEFNVGINCPIMSCLTLRFDFMALYWSKVLRAREQIDRVIDVTQIPNFPPAATATPTGLGQPSVPFNQSGLWILGMGFGAEFKW